MIGQKTLWTKLNTLLENKTFPRFSILVGPKGSGKHLVANRIANELANYVVVIDTKVDSIRTMIEQAYKVMEPTVYIIPDADSMSEVAKNSMLKVTEEPPNNAYFIMTLLDEANTLNTIKSRGTVFHLDNYSPDEILEYYHMHNTGDEVIIKELCNTPGEVDIVSSINVVEFMDYVNLVVDNVHIVEGCNSFKIGSKLALNSEEDKYSLELFWKAFRNECLNRFKDNPVQYADGIKITGKYLQELKNVAVSRQGIFDMWLLEIRDRWYDYADCDAS